MHSLSDDEQKQVLGEILADQLQAIFEYVKEIPAIKGKLAEVDERLIKVEGRLKAVEWVVKDVQADVRLLQRKTA